MAKKNFGTKLFATALATFALASCQSESTLLEPAANNLCDVQLTVTASKGELTRTNLELSEDEKSLLLKWNEGDIIHVSEADGKYAGFLTVTKIIDGGKTAEFFGTVKTYMTDGKRTFTFAYLGKDVKYSAEEGIQMEDKIYELSNQVYTTPQDLVNNDLLLETADVNIKGGNASFENLYMRRQFAYGRFQLLYDSTPLEFPENTVVTISKSDMRNGATLKFPSTVDPTVGDSFTVTTSVNDFYVTFVPALEEEAETSELEFEVNIEQVDYKGSSKPYLIKKNKFFRRAEGLEKALPIPINVSRTDGYDDEKEYKVIYNSNFGDNPQIKEVTDKSTGNGCEFSLSDYDDLGFTASKPYYDFDGWNTEADGTGTQYAYNSVYSFTAPETEVTLYAQWTEHVWTVTWMDGYSEEPMKTETVKGEAGKDISGLYPADPTREGFKPTGWDKYIDNLLNYEPNVVITFTWEQLWDVKWVDADGTQIKQEYYDVDPDKISADEYPGVPAAPNGYAFDKWEITKDEAKMTAVIKPIYKPYTVATPGYTNGTFTPNEVK